MRLFWSMIDKEKTNNSDDIRQVSAEHKENLGNNHR